MSDDFHERLAAALGGHYRLEREVGRGGMAIVYLAFDAKHERTVAVKTLLPELSVTLGAERFLREIKLAARLQHPHILSVYDSGQADGFLYYVMPFVEGESLRQRLDVEKQLPIDEALAIAREVADALAYAHGHGVIHRDIKPENIMLTGGHAVVADFGIARAVQAAGGPKLTETGMAVGTPLYMSPEQALGTDEVGPTSDLYSLACVLYEMLAGEPPFTGPNARAIMARHSIDAVPSLQTVRDTVPDAVEDAIFTALAKVPADRFRTAVQFVEALDAAAGTTAARRALSRAAGRRTPPRPTTGAHGTPGGLRRWSWMFGLVLAVLVMGVIAAWRIVAGRAGGPTGPEPRRIAVLYFEDRSSDHHLTHLADGFTEGLIHELSQVQPLQVISRGGIAPFRGRHIPPDSLARVLNVGSLVDGTVDEVGGRLRLTVALINTATGDEIGSQTLERPREGVFALQDDLVKEVAMFLRKRLGQEVTIQASRAGTRNAAAWEEFQRAQEEARGADALVAAGDVPAASRQLVRADSLLAQVEEMDPKWVTPPAQRAWTAYRQSRLSGSFNQTWYADWTSRGLRYAERALAIKPDDPDALEVRGTLRYWRWLLNLAPNQAAADSLFAQAEADLRAAVAANALQASAWTTLSHLLLNKSETAEAKLAALRAYDADPYLTTANLTVWRLFTSSLDLEDKIEATRWCDEGQRRFPEDPRFVQCRLSLFGLKGVKPDVPEAWHLLSQYVALSPPNLREFRQKRGQMLVAIALVRAGLPDSARAVALRARVDATLDPTREISFFEAVLRTMLGEKEEALRLLSGYLASNPQQRAVMARDESWQFRDLRTDPRWRQVVGGP